MKWPDFLTQIGQMRNEYKILVGKLQGKIPFEDERIIFRGP
jgi:hypothetical protein